MMVDAPSGIQFVGGNIASKLGATSGNSTLALNSGLTGGIASAVSNGDLVIAAFATSSAADRTLAITDGTNNYTLIASELYANDDLDTNLRVAYKFVSGDTATTFGPTGNADEGGATAVYVFRGVNATTPLDATATTATGTNALQPDPPAITPVTSGAFVVSVGASAHISGTAVYNTPSDLIAFRSVGHSDNYADGTMGIGHKDDWVSGSFNPAAWTHPNNTNTSLASWAALTLALRPA